MASGSGEDLVRAFAAWAAAERAAAMAEARVQQRWIAEQVASSATWRGLLVDMAEQSTAVAIWLPDLTCSGRVVGVGRDFCVLAQGNGHPALVVLAWIAAVNPASGSLLPAGDREPALEMSLASALSALAAERLPVSIRARSRTVEGEVFALGEDVVTLRGAPPARQIVHVPLAAVSYCEVR